MKNHASLSDRIRYAIGLRGRTYEQVADGVRVSQPAVAQWATGRKAPSRTNLLQVARYLEVDVDWLERAEGEPPGRLDAELRADYRDSEAGVRWVFRLAPVDGRDYGNSNMWSFAPGIAAFVREVLQNSLDARSSPTVETTFRLVILRGAERAEFLEAIRWDEDLRSHMEASTGSHKVGRFLADGLATVETGDLLLMCIEDRGTSGLTGDELGPGGNFAALTRNNLDSQKSSVAGGAFGLGKAVLWRSSHVLTVLFNSNLSVPDAKNRSTNRVFGKSELGWHETDADGKLMAWAGPGWFGTPTDVNGHAIAESRWDNDALARDLYLGRESGQPGTSLVVVGFHDPSGEYEDVNELASAIAEAAGKWFWPAMVLDRLAVTVEVQEGRVVTRRIPVEPEKVQPAFTALLRDRIDGKVDEALEGGPGATAHRSVTLAIPRRISSTEGGVEPERSHNASLLVRRATPGEDALAYQVAYYRGPGMVVMYEDLKAITAGASPFHAAVLCGEQSDEGPDARSAERFLRTAEPPSHNQWTSTQELKTDYARGGAKAIQDFRVRVKLAIADLVVPPESELDDGPRLLKDLLRLVGDTPPAPPSKPRVVRPRAAAKGNAWEVSAGIFVKASDRGWLGRPVVVFSAETGGGREVAWAELTAVKDCEIRDKKWLFIPPGKREALFKGRTDPKTHPVPVEESSIVIDFREVKETGGES